MEKLRQSCFYKLLIIIILFFLVGVLFHLSIEQFLDARAFFFDDYVQYWSAGRLNLTGGNPYSPEQMAALQIAIGRTENVPVMMWPPPWTLIIAMPLSLLGYPLSRVLWLLLNLGAVFCSANWGWQIYGGAIQKRWIAWVVAFTFAPVLHVLKAGQIAPFLLLGLVGFLYFACREQWWFAGACVALITIKPHLLYLFGFALLLWSLDRRCWGALGGFVVGLVLAMGIAWGINPSLVNQYVYALANYPPAEWATPTLGALLRIWLGIEKFWLQFVPSVIGVVWFIVYWRKHSKGWDWTMQLPVLVLVSVVTAAYGWTFDYPVFLLAIIQVVVWLIEARRSKAAGGLLVAYVGLMVVSIFSSMDQLWYWWMASWFLGWYLIAQAIYGNNATTEMEVLTCQ